MYGKHFASLYGGSMIGAGSHVFALWGYVIACQVPDRRVGSQVELNPKLLAFVIGETEERINQAIEYLCRPDAKSRTDTEGGRRLIRLGEFTYQVVNGAKYRAIRTEEGRREQNRQAQRRRRAKVPPHSEKLSGEAAYERAAERGATEEELGTLADPQESLEARREISRPGSSGRAS